MVTRQKSCIQEKKSVTLNQTNSEQADREPQEIGRKAMNKKAAMSPDLEY